MANIKVQAALRRVHTFLDRTQQVTGALAGFRELNAFSGVGLAAQLARLATEFVSRDISELSKGWKSVVLPSETRSLVEEVCSPFRENGGDSWDFYKIAGQGVFFQHQDHFAWRFMVEHDPETFLYQVREAIWSQQGSHVILVPNVTGPYTVEFQIRSHEPKPGLSSERALQIWERIEPYLRAGVTRSLLLDGRPGTGKTTMAQFLVDLARRNLHSPRVLRIPTGDFAFMGSSMLQGLIGLMRPSVLVIDDFDRISGIESLLDFLEGCRKWVKFVVVTTNHLENLPHAVTRPGRFDEIQIIEGLGASFVESYLGPLWKRMSEDERKLVLPWPVAFLEELRSRMGMLSKAILSEELEDLRIRVEKKEIPWWKKETKETPHTTTAKA